VLRHFALVWTLLWGAHLLVTAGVGVVLTRAAETESDRSSGLSMVVLLAVIYGVVWLVPAVGALLLGLVLRKSSVVERRPESRRASV
jgi:Na+/proline symporter